MQMHHEQGIMVHHTCGKTIALRDIEDFSLVFISWQHLPTSILQWLASIADWQFSIIIVYRQLCLFSQTPEDLK